MLKSLLKNIDAFNTLYENEIKTLNHQIDKFIKIFEIFKLNHRTLVKEVLPNKLFKKIFRLQRKNNLITDSDKFNITQKHFRWSDFIAEKVIKSVAFISITIIILIFIFVFRESFPIFKTVDKNINHDAIEGIVGLLYKDWDFAYSYDFTVSKLVSNSGGSHEISITYIFNQKDKTRAKKIQKELKCPQTIKEEAYGK